jgi:replicative superfamily II helicase
MDDVMEWLETTFYYVRAQSAPDGAGDGSTDYPFGGNLRTRARDTLDDLVADGFVEEDRLRLEPTALGRLASKFYMRLDTARAFADLTQAAGDGRHVEEGDVLRTVAAAAEFDSVSARRAEREAVDSVLGQSFATDAEGEDLDPGHRKVLAICRGSMRGSTPAELQSDAWVIRQNVLRLLAALHAFAREFADARVANLVRRVEARVDTGIAADAVGLTAVEGVARGRAQKLAAEGPTTPADLLDAGVDGLVDAGLAEGVAERVLENARDLPAVAVDWGAFPDEISRGERAMCQVTVRSTAGNARAGVRVTVNGREMTATETHLGETDLTVGVFGTDKTDELTYRVEVAFPGLPLPPVTECRTVRVA